MYYRLSFYQNNLKEFLYRIGKIEDELCRFCCMENESLNHIFTKCTKLDYSILRYKCITKNVLYSTEELIVNEDLKIYVLSFLKKYFTKD